MTIRDIISKKEKRKIVTVDGNVGVSQAVAEMVSAKVGSVLVLIENSLEGIFTERDALKLWIKGESMGNSPVLKYMTSPLIVTDMEDSVENAMSVMSENNIRHLIVTEGKKIIDVLSMKDVIRAHYGDLGTKAKYLDSDYEME